jgi:O-antigen ligase
VFLDTTSTLSGKSRSNIVAMTGRLELWTTIWESARHQPWGFGFAAFERTLSLSNSSMSWKAGNAHNGFISAWLGAGWLAVALLLSYLASVWAKQQTIDVTQRPVFLTLLLLIVLNNLTVPAVGGRLTVEFLVLMALSHIPVARRFDTPELRPYARA